MHGPLKKHVFVFPMDAPRLLSALKTTCSDGRPAGMQMPFCSTVVDAQKTTDTLQ